MMRQLPSDDITSRQYTILLHLKLMSAILPPFWLKRADFKSDNQVRISFYCKKVLSDENEWSNQFLMMLHSQGMVLSLIFSHFSHYQQKMADFEGDIEVSRFYYLNLQ